MSISSLLVGMGILLLGNGLLGTLVGLALARQNATALISGLVMAGYFLGLLLGALRAGKIIGTVGHIRAFSAFASVFSAAALAHAFLDVPAIWGLLRIAEGFCMAGLFMCAESWLNHRAEPENRGTILSIYMITAYLSQGLAQGLLTFGQTDGFVLFATVSILTSVALVPVALTRMRQPSLVMPKSMGIKALYRISPSGLAGCFCAGLVMGVLYSLTPLFGERLGLGVDGVAALMAAVILGGLCLQWPLGKLSDRMDRRLIMAGSALGILISSLALVALSMWATVDLYGEVAGPGQELIVGREGDIPLWQVVPLITLFGAFAGLLYPVSLATTADFVPADDMVAAMGGLLFVYGLGAVLGPLAAGAAMEILGRAGLFLFTGAVCVPLVLFVFARFRSRELPQDEDRVSFQMVPRTTVIAAELDPRVEIDPQYAFDFDPVEDRVPAPETPESPEAPETPATRPDQEASPA
ncbi:MAG: MFS transporter [Rhodospirillaceae bacterium]